MSGNNNHQVSEESTRDNLFRNINFLWVGPPTIKNPASLAGHDIAGPIKMAQQIIKQGLVDEHPITFWCLSEHEEYYRDVFNGFKLKIDVSAIEPYLKRKSEDEGDDNANFMLQHLSGLKETTYHRVGFKDGFSLYLLINEAGYYFDTNVFPSDERELNLTGGLEVQTARSGYQDSHDFYLMYSPEIKHVDVQGAFARWRRRPKICNLDALGLFSPEYLDCQDLGVKKISYKSYFGGERLLGLFSWFEIASNTDDLEEAIKWGDINQQVSNPSSLIVLKDYSLARFRGESITEEALLDLPFSSDVGYVAASKDHYNDFIFYVNKITQECRQIYEGPSGYDFFRIFPHQILSNIEGDYPKACAYSLLRDFLKDPSIPKPALLENKDNCTLLHHAVMENEPWKVTFLLKVGARTDLKATYVLQPEGQEMELTAKELAIYLKKESIAALFGQNESACTPDDLDEANNSRDYRSSLGLFGNNNRKADDAPVDPSTKTYQHRNKLGPFAYGMFSPLNIIKNILNDVVWNATTTQRRETRVWREYSNRT